MPAKQEACTATITEIKDNDADHFMAKVYDSSGNLIQTHPELTFEIMDSLNSNPEVSKIHVEGNIPFVTAEDVSLVLVDTPGPNNSRDPEHKAATYRMLSNAIAEMRTYGEGFIIADQSPSAVDISAIRNTNTKIIMRLPDEQDRRLAGKSAGLRDNQLDEIAKLPKGVAVVYQNDWLEPVLCKIGKFRGEEHRYQREAQNCTTFSCNRATALIQNLLNKTAGERLDMNLSELSAWIIGMDIPSHTKISALKALRLNGSCTLGDISPVIYDLIYSPSVEKEAEEADSIEEWKNVLVYANNSALADLNEQDQNVAVECILREQIERFGKPSEYLDTWRKFLKREVM